MQRCMLLIAFAKLGRITLLRSWRLALQPASRQSLRT